MEDFGQWLLSVGCSKPWATLAFWTVPRTRVVSQDRHGECDFITLLIV